MSVYLSGNRTSSHPMTPNPRKPCSKRSWDGQVRKWRRALHQYDPPMTEEQKQQQAAREAAEQEALHDSADAASDGSVEGPRVDL